MDVSIQANVMSKSINNNSQDVQQQNAVSKSLNNLSKSIDYAHHLRHPPKRSPVSLEYVVNVYLMVIDQ